MRDEVLQKVFDSVRQARPSTLLLWQDGPRKDSPDDYERIERCRKIEYFIRCIIYGECGRIFNAITRRFKNTCG